MQYGFKAHAVKHEPIALQVLEQTLELGYNFALRALEDANRFITDSKSRLKSSHIFKAHRHWNSALFPRLTMIVCYLFLVGWLVAGWIVAERLDRSRCH